MVQIITMRDDHQAVHQKEYPVYNVMISKQFQLQGLTCAYLTDKAVLNPILLTFFGSE